MVIQYNSPTWPNELPTGDLGVASTPGHCTVYTYTCMYKLHHDRWGASLMHPSGHDVTDLFHVVS